MKRQPTLVILVGNIGSGKSTLVKQIYSDCQIISRDEWRYKLGCGNYLFDYGVEIKINCLVNLELQVAMQLGNDIVIDEMNMAKKTRKHYINAAKEQNYRVMAVVFPDLGEEEHVRRRMESNHGYTTEQRWREVYRRNAQRFQMPTFEEGFDFVSGLPRDLCYE